MCHSFPNHLGRHIPTLSAHKHILTHMNPSHLGGHIPHTYSFVILNLQVLYILYKRLLSLYAIVIVAHGRYLQIVHVRNMTPLLQSAAYRF